MIKKKAKFFGFVTILVIILTTTFSCTNKKNKSWKQLKAADEAHQDITPHSFPCLKDSILGLLKTEKVPQGELNLPIGDSTAFFHQFPKKWNKFIRLSNSAEQSDSLNDAMLACLTECQKPSAGLIFKTNCYSAYLITNEKEGAYWQQVGLVTVSPNNKLIDTLNLRSLYTFKSKDMTYQRFFYIGKDSIIHTKIIGKSNYNEERFFGSHDEFRILGNGVIAPFHEVDFETELVDKGLLGSRILKGKTILGFPHGHWQITELDMGMPYPEDYEKYVDFTYSVAEGDYFHGAKVGTWNYYKMKLDTVVNRHGQTFTFPTYEKSDKIIKTEIYSQGVIVSKEFFHGGSDLLPISTKNVNAPLRYTSNLHRNLIGRKYYVNNPEGISLRENVNSNVSLKNISYGEEIEIVNDGFNIAKEYFYFENVLVNMLKVKSGGVIGYISDKYLSPLPLPKKEFHQKITLEEYASKYSNYVSESKPNSKYFFKNCDVAEAFFFLRNLKFEKNLFVWINATPLVEGFENSSVKSIFIEKEEVPGYNAPLSFDGKFYKIKTLTFTFNNRLPFQKATFKAIGDDVELEFEINNN